MKTATCALAALSAALAATIPMGPALAAPHLVRTYEIDIAGVDLRDESSRAEVEKSIRAAVRGVCGARLSNAPAAHDAQHACRVRAMEDALAQLKARNSRS